MKIPTAKEWLDDATVIEKKPRVDMFQVGPKMRAMREKTGLSLRKTALAIGISGCYLHDMEKGFRTIKEPVLQRFIDFCTQQEGN